MNWTIPRTLPALELAGKRVRFDLTIKELKEKEVPELNDEFAQSLGSGQFETLEALREEFRQKLLEREEQSASQTVRDQILRKILGKVQFEISPRVIEREADRILQNLKHQFESQGLKFDADTLNTSEYRTGSRLQAEKDIRTGLVIDRIAEAEAISLDSEEEEQVFRDIAAAYRIDLAKVQSEYRDSAIVEREKERKLQDKVLKFIESEAVFVGHAGRGKGARSRSPGRRTRAGLIISPPTRGHTGGYLSGTHSNCNRAEQPR